jgi:hypothetical protein
MLCKKCSEITLFRERQQNKRHWQSSNVSSWTIFKFWKPHIIINVGQIINHCMQAKSSVTACRSNHVTTYRPNHVTTCRPNHQSPHASQIISHHMQVKSSVTAAACLSLQLVSAPLEMGTSYCAPRDVSHQSLCVRVAIISLHIHHYALLLTAANIPAQKSFLFSKPAERSRKVRQNHVKGSVDPVASHHSVWGRWVLYPSVITLAFRAREWSDLGSGRFNPSTHWTGGRMCIRDFGGDLG